MLPYYCSLLLKATFFGALKLEVLIYLLAIMKEFQICASNILLLRERVNRDEIELW
jgi:hypothetical protein